MPPTDAGTAPAADPGTDVSPGQGESSPGPGETGVEGARGANNGACNEDTLDLRLPDDFGALIAGAEVEEEVEAEAEAGADPGWGPSNGSALRFFPTPAGDDLLDHVGDWGATTTPVGEFHLVPVCIERDLPLISRWMNDPAVAAFWELADPRSATEDHLRAQLDGDGRSVPCLGVLKGTPMSYWEIYRADLDPLARHYPARPHDTGLHLLIGAAADRARGLGSVLLRAVAELALDKRSVCARVVAEPDLRNTPSVAAFLNAGFRFSAEVDLPAKRAALMVRDRSLRDLL